MAKRIWNAIKGHRMKRIKFPTLKRRTMRLSKPIHRFEGALRIYVSDVKKIVRGPRFIRSIKLTKLDGDMKKIRGMLETSMELVLLETWSAAGKKNRRMISSGNTEFL